MTLVDQCCKRGHPFGRSQKIARSHDRHRPGRDVISGYIARSAAAGKVRYDWGVLSDRRKGAELHAYPGDRSVGSRSQIRCRFAAVMKPAIPSRPSSGTTPTSAGTAAFYNRAAAAATYPMTLRWPKASRNQSMAAACSTSDAQPSADGSSATASKKMDGAAESA